MEAGKILLAKECGESLDDFAMEVGHMTYNAPRGQKIIKTCIGILEERIREFRSSGAWMIHSGSKEESKKITRAKESGIKAAEAVLRAAQMPGVNLLAGEGMVEACIQRLKERIDEIKAVPGKPEYVKARYGKEKQ